MAKAKVGRIPLSSRPGCPYTTSNREQIPTGQADVKAQERLHFTAQALQPLPDPC